VEGVAERAIGRMTREARHILGIDLGTTHTALGWADTPGHEAATSPAIFPISQLVSATGILAEELLPSVLYAPLPEEQQGDWVVGTWARDRAWRSPTDIASAKSWLCWGCRGAILPWGAREE
jgi:molecular chaperone DnaK (HSP70)